MVSNVITKNSCVSIKYWKEQRGKVGWGELNLHLMQGVNM